MPKLYQPANGDEGDYFQGDWCCRCEKDRAAWQDDDFENGCKILARTYYTNTNDEDFPQEWRYCLDTPVCTAFEEATHANS
jgi:hypothetical protein